MTSLQTLCRQCGGRLLGGDRFCAQCGTPQEESSDGSVEGLGSTPWDGVFDHLRSAIGSKYEIGRPLGYGGMAAVLLAREIRLNRRVAIKVMSPSLMLAPGMVERFQREAVTVAALNHPNIVTIHTVEETERVHYFVMKYVPGPSLEAVIKKDGPLPISVVKVWLSQVASALGYAHRRGVIHRDVKPANILLDDEGNAIVTDFGIAKVAREPSLTQVGATVGTPAYMSPEQCQSKDVTAASDQYSLGIVLYEMLTGEPPFSGPTLEVMQAHVHAPPRLIAGVRPDCPRELQAAIHRMLSKEPASRWSTMEELIAAAGGPPLTHDDPIRLQLVELASGKATTPVPSGPPPLLQPAAPEIASMELRPPRRVIPVGRTRRLKVVARGVDGRPLRGRPIRWESSDHAVVEVGPDGSVRGLAVGSATVRAISNGSSGAADVQVRAATFSDRVARMWWTAPLLAVAVSAWVIFGPDSPPQPPPPPLPAYVTITPDAPTITVGESIPLVAAARSEQGEILQESLSWNSSDSTIAALDPAGTLRGLKPGAVTITASTASGISATTVGTVRDRGVASVSVTPTRVTLEVDRSARLRAVPRNDNRDALPRPVEWETSNAAVATVAPNGSVTGRAPGTALVVAVSEGARSAPVTISVRAAAPRAPGVLQMLIVPTWAYVSIGGLSRGQRVRGVDTLPAGVPHRIRFERDGFTTIDTTVTLRAGEQRLIRIQMTPRNP